MRISDWSSDVCSSDLLRLHVVEVAARPAHQCRIQLHAHVGHQAEDGFGLLQPRHRFAEQRLADVATARSEEIGRAHVELQSLMRISYAVLCLIKTNAMKL